MGESSKTTQIPRTFAQTKSIGRAPKNTATWYGRVRRATLACLQVCDHLANPEGWAFEHSMAQDPSHISAVFLPSKLGNVRYKLQR